MPSITLKAARVNAGLTQAEAASAIGISDSKLRNWEHGVGLNNMTLGQRMIIGDLYRIPMEHIYLPLDIGDPQR